MNKEKLKDILKKYLQDYNKIENEVNSFISFCEIYNIDFPLDRIVEADNQVDGSFISVVFKSASGIYSIEVEIPTTNIGNSSVTITIKNIKTDDGKYKTPSKFYIDKYQDFNLLQYIVKFLKDEYENVDDFIKDFMDNSRSIDKVLSENTFLKYFIFAVIHSGEAELEKVIDFIYKNYDGADYENINSGLLFDNKK